MVAEVKSVAVAVTPRSPKENPGSQRRSKIPSRRIPSDDCVVHIGQALDEDGEVIEEGEEIAVHIGEWVELIPLTSVNALLTLQELAAEGTKTALQEVSRIMAEKITAWNWTGLEYEELPNPPSTEDIMTLSDDEWLYLMRQVRDGGSKVQRKNV